MARIRWKSWVGIENKAIGLPGPRLTHTTPGTEMDVPDAAVKQLAEMYGEGSFEVIKEPAKAPEKGKGN